MASKKSILAGIGRVNVESLFQPGSVSMATAQGGEIQNCEIPRSLEAASYTAGLTAPSATCWLNIIIAADLHSNLICLPWGPCCTLITGYSPHPTSAGLYLPLLCPRQYLGANHRGLGRMEESEGYLVWALIALLGQKFVAYTELGLGLRAGNCFPEKYEEKRKM